MTRVSDHAGWAPIIRFGAGGNVYVICKAKSPLSQICIMIRKATSSIYWNNKHKCYAFRIKNQGHKLQLSLCFGDIKVSEEMKNGLL